MVEFTAWMTSPSARSSSTKRTSSSVRARNSLSSRVFSMAMTACLRHQLDLLFGERPNFRSIDHERTDQLTFLEHWHCNK